MRRLFLALVVALSPAHPGAAEPGTWAFDPGPDTFSPAAALDLSYLNEGRAGETGFVRRSEDGASFVRGDGTPIRFWAVNTTVARKGLPALREHARFLAKRGVNMVRLHGQIAQARARGGGIEAIDTRQRDQLWQLVAAMKEAGIYVTFSPYFPHAVHENAARRWTVPQDSPGLTGMIYFDPVLQSAYKGWLRQTLTPVNPHTGLALKDDPGLAILQMQNEDSLLFWTVNSLRGREARLLAARFGTFLTRKYGSLDAARAAWDGAAAPGPIDEMIDDWQTGVIALSKIWHLTSEVDPGSAAARLRDQAEFLTTTMRDWHVEIARFLKDEIGARQLFNAGNWKTADPIVLDDLERYSYAAGEVIGVNRYVGALHKGEKRGWAIRAGDRFREERCPGPPAGSAHRTPPTSRLSLYHHRNPLGAADVATIRRPDPDGGLPGFDRGRRQLLVFNRRGPVACAAPRQSPPAQHRQMGAGNTPADRRLPRRSADLSPGPGRRGAARDRRPSPAAALWDRARPVAATKQGKDPNRDDILDRVGPLFRSDDANPATASPYSFLAGPVHVVFDSNDPTFVHPDLDDLVDEDRQVARSVTGELEWNWRERVVTINAPRAQGVVGALSSRSVFELQDVRIESDAEYASILVVPLDEEPIGASDVCWSRSAASPARPVGGRAVSITRTARPWKSRPSVRRRGKSIGSMPLFRSAACA